MRSGSPGREADLRGRSPYPERPDRVPGAFDAVCAGIFNRLVPSLQRSPPRRLREQVTLVDAMEADADRMSDAELRTALSALRPRLVREGLRAPLVVPAFALLREAARRSLGLRPHGVQLIGAFALLEGRLAEMDTGEGKTVAASLAAATSALAGVATHIVTVNDYLAKRDADLVRPMLDYAGLSVGAVLHEQDADERRRQYRHDLTYVSNKELAFDYLRDRAASARLSRLSLGDPILRPLRSAADAPVLRGLHYAIVDEADSILIDEARTPLVLAEHDDAPAVKDDYLAALAVASTLREGIDFTLASSSKTVRLTARGEANLAVGGEDAGGLWRARRARQALVSQAVAARYLYARDRDYVIANDAIRIVDEHTGRIAEGRSWQQGLHQMVEIIEGVTPSAHHTTRNSITYQSFFRRYIKLAGMSGTLAEVAREMALHYRLRTLRIPPHRPVSRRDGGTNMFASESSKRDHIVRSAHDAAASGRPVLIGTRSVLSSEHLSACLDAAGLVHTVLNARHDAKEAAIVAGAGRSGCITIATSMAGRGTDIRLDEAARRAGGLHVIVSEPHDSKRLDRQLIGRGGRQGDPGSYETCLSFDDVLLRTHAPGCVSLLCRFHLPIRVMPGLAVLLRAWTQHAAGRHQKWSRRQLLLARQALQDELSFAQMP